jgi:GH43 family beta-xylosidase
VLAINPVLIGREDMQKRKQQTRSPLPIFHNKFVDRKMTEGHNDFVQFAETHARYGKKNFHHVDILLKS